MPKPNELYLGVLDFFAIILPGAIAAALLERALGGAVLGLLVTVPKSEAGQWAAFLVIAYLLGHLIFLTGSYLDFLYGWLTKRLSQPQYGQGWRSVAGKPVLKNELAYLQATAVRKVLLAPELENGVNTFQWARAVLTSRCPAAAADVQQLEADSKFFRSFVVLTVVTGFACLAQLRWVEGLVALVLVIPCFARYCERRLKSTTQAYTHILTMHGLGELSGKPEDKASATAAPGPSLRP
jgi:hypothetical protein